MSRVSYSGEAVSRLSGTKHRTSLQKLLEKGLMQPLTPKAQHLFSHQGTSVILPQNILLLLLPQLRKYSLPDCFHKSNILIVLTVGHRVTTTYFSEILAIIGGWLIQFIDFVIFVFLVCFGKMGSIVWGKWVQKIWGHNEWQILTTMLLCNWTPCTSSHSALCLRDLSTAAPIRHCMVFCNMKDHSLLVISH